MPTMHGNIRDTRNRMERIMRTESVRLLPAEQLNQRDLELAASQIVRNLINDLRLRGHDMRETHGSKNRFSISIHIGG